MFKRGKLGVVDGVESPPHPLQRDAELALGLALKENPEALAILYQKPDGEMGVLPVPPLHAVQHALISQAYDAFIMGGDEE